MKQKIFLLTFILSMTLYSQSEKAFYITTGANLSYMKSYHYDSKTLPGLGGYVGASYMFYGGDTFHFYGNVDFSLRRVTNELHSSVYNYQVKHRYYNYSLSIYGTIMNDRLIQPKFGIGGFHQFLSYYTHNIYKDGKLIYTNNSDLHSDGVYVKMIIGANIKINDKILLNVDMSPYSMPFIRVKNNNGNVGLKGVMNVLNFGILYRIN